MPLRIYGNRQLKTLPGQATRPTTGRVREALFNIWRGSIMGCDWLDLCAGNGVIGAEALCRGAQSVVGIEQSDLACRTLQQNWQQVARPEQTFQVMQGNILKLLPKLSGQQFHHIYFDPPYQSGLYEPVMTAIAHYQLLALQGELAVEHAADASVAIAPVTGLTLRTQKKYGRTGLSFYTPTSESAIAPSEL